MPHPAHLPKWHWPLAGNKRKIEQWRKKFPVQHNQKEMREQFLDGLAGYASWEKEQKKEAMANWKGLSHFQRESLIQTFQAENRTFLNLGATYRTSLLEHLFECQLDWAQFVLEEKAGREAMLLWPLEGRGAFPRWEPYFIYWTGWQRWCR